MKETLVFVKETLVPVKGTLVLVKETLVFVKGTLVLEYVQKSFFIRTLKNPLHKLTLYNGSGFKWSVRESNP